MTAREIVHPAGPRHLGREAKRLVPAGPGETAEHALDRRDELIGNGAPTRERDGRKEDQVGDPLGDQLGHLRNHHPAHGMADDDPAGDAGERHRVRHRPSVGANAGLRVLAGAPAVPRQIHGHDRVAFGLERLLERLPAPGAVGGAVNQDVFLPHASPPAQRYGPVQLNTPYSALLPPVSQLNPNPRNRPFSVLHTTTSRLIQ